MKILFCDWNGTLLDDMPIWEKAMRKTFLSFGVVPPTIEEYFRKLESGDYLEVYKKYGITASREKLNEIYGKVYKELMFEAKLFPETAQTLLQLKVRGVFIVLVTAQEKHLIIPLLDKFMIRSYFKLCEFKALDKKAAIGKIMRDNSADPKECYLVGDSPSDIRHAKKSGVISIAFLNGYIPEDLLKAVNPDYYIRNFEEILEVV